MWWGRELFFSCGLSEIFYPFQPQPPPHNSGSENSSLVPVEHEGKLLDTKSHIDNAVNQEETALPQIDIEKENSKAVAMLPKTLALSS